MIGTNGSYVSSQYLVRVDTIVGWANYIEKKWGNFKKALRTLGLLAEFLSTSDDIRVAAVSTTMNYILSNYIPSEENCILSVLSG